MIYPKFIKENATIGVPTPSAGSGALAKQNKIINAKNNLEQLGYNLILSKNILKCEKGRSANKIERAKEINNMFNNDEIDMILCATGGDFLIEILPNINFEILKNKPKLIAGFSDPTGLLYPITTKYDIATIYGHNLSPLGMEKYHQSERDFLEIIKGNLINQQSYELYETNYQEKITGLEYYNLTEKVLWKTLDNQDITIKGRIIGGCLDIISTIAGTKYDGINQFNEKYKNDGIIWYFDNCELTMEETIRVLWKLNELNYFKYTKGIVFGRFGVTSTLYDYDTKTCLQDSIVSSLNIPIIYDADISHKAPCMTIINGSISTITVKNNKGTISFELK